MYEIKVLIMAAIVPACFISKGNTRISIKFRIQGGGDTLKDVWKA
jgi:hypothetical protein